MKPWYLADTLIQAFENSEPRRLWSESGAYDHFYEMERLLAPHFKDRARMGALYIAEMLGTDGKNFWMFPIEGHKKILSPKSLVTLLDKQGTVFYEGMWEACNEGLVLKHEEFFVWLKPIQGRQPVQLSLKKRLQGLWRRIRYAKK